MDKLGNFSYRVLDNVHGFIYYTETERKIIDSLLFKRLQSIKQLSIVNWVFPGSEHTRFIHSLGVMYLADKIASRFTCLTDNERKIVRLAGLLHDIGHYPLSHVCEYPYKESPTDFPGTNYCINVNYRVKQRIDSFQIKTKCTFMEKSSGLHHEQVGANIVLQNKELFDLIVSECGKDAPQIIADMITGNVERKLCEHHDLLVQILHSEIDADGIDYLMRDASFSGTSFGNFELDQLIGCMEVGEYEGKNILCLNPKGIAAADQYLINKFFSYTQVVYNKHISITEWMAEQIVDWMQKNDAYFPKSATLKEWTTSSEVPPQYINFTDNYFWASLQNLLSNPLSGTEPRFIQSFCNKLLCHEELEYERDTEVKLISSDADTIRNTLQESMTYKRLDSWQDRISIFSTRSMSKHTPQKMFEDAITNLVQAEDRGNGGISPEDIPLLKTRRFMEGTCIKANDGSMHLLCDDSRSLMRVLYNQHFAVLRAFKCPL